jgi:hypothetical protein
MLLRRFDKQLKNILECRDCIFPIVQIASQGKFGHVENLAATGINHSYMECVLPANLQQSGAMYRFLRSLLGAGSVHTLANSRVLWRPGLRISLHISPSFGIEASVYLIEKPTLSAG